MLVSKQLKYKGKNVLACTKTGRPQNGKLPLDFERQEMAGVGKATGRGGVSQRPSVENHLFPRCFSFSSVFFWGKEFQAGPPFQTICTLSKHRPSFLLPASSDTAINIPTAFRRSREMHIAD